MSLGIKRAFICYTFTYGLTDAVLFSPSRLKIVRTRFLLWLWHSCGCGSGRGRNRGCGLGVVAYSLDESSLVLIRIPLSQNGTLTDNQSRSTSVLHKGQYRSI